MAHTEESPVPPLHLRRMKTQFEDELKIKLGSKKDRVGIHPLIQCQTLQRAKTCCVIDYHPVSRTQHVSKLPPTTKSYSPWRVDCEAGRQLLQNSRRGPRSVFFSSGKQPIFANHKNVEKIWEDQRKRAEDELDDTLESVFSSWRVLYSRSKVENGMGQGGWKVAERRERILGQKRKLETRTEPKPASPTEDKHFISEDLEYLMKKMSYWRQIKRAPALMNTYARDVTRIPQAPRTEVRIYISSTPDLTEEREMLETITQPALERTLDKYGISCHFVDLRLGINRLATEADAINIVQHEIDKCKRISLGPTFIALIGNELDCFEIPHEIESKVFDSIRGIILKEKLPYLDLIDECYRLDSNNLPPTYFLQIVEDVNEFLEENDDGNDIMERLAFVLQEALSIGVKTGRIDMAAQEMFKLSVTHFELEHGFLRTPNPENQALCVLVKDGNWNLRRTSRTHSTVDVEETLKDFVEDVCPENLLEFSMKTKTMDYLKALHETVLLWLVEATEKTIAEMDFDIRDHVGEISEMLHHMHMANALCHCFIARDLILTSFQKRLETQFNLQKPIAIYGKRGSGKSTFMAKLARVFPEWTNNKAKVVVRFIGTSAESSRLFSLLVGLCHQICAMFNSKALEIEERFSIPKLIDAWNKCIKSISKFVSVDQPLVILIDAVDNLVENEEWIPPTLPEGVLLIASKQNQRGHQRGVEAADKTNIFSLTELEDKDILDSTRRMMRNENRKLTDDQLQLILDNLSEEISTLRLSILLCNARMWPSTILPPRDTAKTVEASLKSLLMRLESGLGRTFVKYSLCFVALAKFGLTEKELTDNLKRNDTLIHDTIAVTVKDGSYLTGVPVQLNLTRMLLLIKTFILECKKDGQTIITFKTQQLRDLIVKRYDKEGFGISLHRDLAKYFMLQCRDFVLTGRSSSASQVFKINKLNLRMLRSVPYHLCQSHSDGTPTDQILKVELFCNMHWFLSRVLSSPFLEVLADLESTLEIFEDRELDTLYDLLRHSKNALIHDPFHLFVILVDGHSQIPKCLENLSVLISQAQECLKRTDVTQLLPKHKMCLNIGNVMKMMYPMTGEVRAITVDHMHIIIVNSSTVCCMNLSTREIEVYLTSLSGDRKEDICVRCDKRGHIYISSKQSLSIWDSKRRVELHSIPLDLPAAGQVEIISANTVLVQSNKRLFLVDVPNETTSECVVLQSDPVCWDLSANKQLCFTLHDNPRMALDIWSFQTKKLIKRIPMSYMGKPLLRQPLLVTDDGLYVVVCFQYKVLVIDAIRHKYLEGLGHENRCLRLSTLTRCNEHVILADTMGTISVWKLRTSDEVCSFSALPPKEDLVEDFRADVTEIAISEDDHFMFVGLSSGQFVVHHIPTQCTVMVVQAHLAEIQALVFLTNFTLFQHLITCSAEGVVKLWNLEHLLSDARKQLFPFILDKDLLNEERQKLHKRHYFSIYDRKRNNKTFLNGADILGFFGNPSSETFERTGDFIVESHHQWITKQTLGHCRNVELSVTGYTKPVLATLQIGVGIAIWNINAGTLMRLITRKGKSEKITTMMFLDEDHLIAALSTAEELRQSITVWDTATGEPRLTQEKCLSCAMSDSPPRIFCIFPTNRRDQTLFKCWELDTSGILSAYVQMTPTVAETSTDFMGNIHVNIMIHRREKSTELRLLHMDSYDDHDVTAQATATEQDNPPSCEITADEYCQHVGASVRLMKFPFPALCVHLNNDRILLLLEAGEVLQLNAISGTVVWSITLGGGALAPGQLVIESEEGALFESIRSSEEFVISTSRDGTYFLVSMGKTVQTWSMDSRRKVCQFSVGPGQVKAVAISDDNSSVVTGTSMGAVQVWTVSAGALVCSFPALSSIAQIFIDRAGKQVVALLDDMDERRVIVLDVKEPQSLLT